MKLLGLITIFTFCFGMNQELLIIDKCDLYVSQDSPLGILINQIKKQDNEVECFMIVDRHFGVIRAVDEYTLDLRLNRLIVKKYSLNSQLDTVAYSLEKFSDFKLDNLDCGLSSFSVVSDLSEIMSHTIDIYMEHKNNKLHLEVGSVKTLETLKESPFSQLFEPVFSLMEKKE